MIVAELPVDEELRIKDLISYDILDTRPESDFDELVELASQICNCPISLISLLDNNRQWFKARKGLADTHTSKDIAFCSHAILQDKVLTVEDATKDTRFFDNPLVTGDLNIRFYAGAPIVSPLGYKLGTICVIDHIPKKLSADEERSLFLLSNQVTKLIELRKKNMLIRQRAEEIISLKSSAISTELQKNQEDKKAIATNLHEVIAQDIASSMIILNMAETNEADRIPLLLTARNQLNESLNKLRKLSYSITPMTTSWLSIEELVGEYIDKVSDTFPFDIQFYSIGEKNTLASDKTTLVIHIIEKWMKKLADNGETSLLTINLHSGQEFELLMEDDAPVNNLMELGDMVYECLLPEMAAPRGGRVDFTISGTGKKLVKVALPFNTA